MNNNQNPFLQEQTIKQLKEKVESLEYIIQLYQKKEDHNNGLHSELEHRINYLEGILGMSSGQIKPLKAVKGGKFVNQSKIDLIDGI